MKPVSQMEPWIGEEERLAVDAYLASGGWLTEFKKTQEFEASIAAYVGTRHCVVTHSGTIALALALMGLEIGKGDEVIVPDYTMIASANAVHLAGATPVLVDIEPRTLCMDIEAAERAITPRTKALMLVSLDGRAPSMGTFLELCHRRGITLVEDAAQSLGSFHQGKHLGTFGQVGCFSFSMPKVITTGQGGAVVTDSPEIDRRLRLVKDFGRERAGVDIHVTMGYNFKFTDLQAVVGLEQMKKLPWRVERKKQMLRLYQQLLEGVPEIELVATSGETAPWFFDILVPANSRAALAADLKGQGIGTRPFYPAIHTQQPYCTTMGSFPVSEEISQRGLWLPSSSFLTDDDIVRVCDGIKAFSKSVSPAKEHL